MVVSNKTEVDNEACYKLLMNTTKKDYIKKSWLIVIIFLIGIPVIVIGQLQNEIIYTIMGSIFIGLSFVYLGVTVYNMKRIPKMLKEKNKEVLENGATYYYNFREQAVEIEIKTLDKRNKLKLPYTDLRKITEYKDHYELRFISDYILYVDKSGFTEKKMEEFFRTNITKRTPKKPRKIVDKKDKEKSLH